ncbi:MAG: ankyrin repeat domain-containing protein [Armatimonadota bacterium]
MPNHVKETAPQRRWLLWLLIAAVVALAGIAVRQAEVERPLYISAREAIEAGDMTDLEYHLSHGADIHNLDEAGYTLLHTAARHGRPEVAKLLISKGIDPDAREPRTLNDYTPLHLAARENNAAVVQVLITAGADPDALDAQKRTPLHMAALTDAADAARVLLEHGARPNLQDDEEITPLGLAVKWDKSRVGRVMVQYGAKQ